MIKRAVCLISGGIDSCVTSYLAKLQGYEIYALTFDYGQRHKKEVESAKKIVKKLGVRQHKVLKIDLTQWGGSALTNKSIKVPKTGKIGKDIPITYVPARNTILLSFALGYAEVVKAEAIFMGANCLDYSGYPDCRPEYYKAFQKMANLATKRGVEGSKVKILTPLINLTKGEIIKKGIELEAPLRLTWSCYEGKEKACGRCDSCILRLKGFREAGLKDPLEYFQDLM